MSLGRCNTNDFNVISTFEVLGVNAFFLLLTAIHDGSLQIPLNI